jgi:hypothetical protein
VVAAAAAGVTALKFSREALEATWHHRHYYCCCCAAHRQYPQSPQAWEQALVQQKTTLPLLPAIASAEAATQPVPPATLLHRM